MEQLWHAGTGVMHLHLHCACGEEIAVFSTPLDRGVQNSWGPPDDELPADERLGLVADEITLVAAHVFALHFGPREVRCSRCREGG